MNRHRATRLICKQLSGEATSREQSRLRKWLGRSPDHEALQDELKNLWTTAGDDLKIPFPDVGACWQEIESRISRAPVHQAAGRIPFPLRGRVSLRPALVLAVLAAALVLVWWGFLQDLGLENLKTGNGQWLTARLPDSTMIRLNSGSQLSYQKPFDLKERRVFLRGEAFFDVNYDTRPFIVDTRNARIRVTGTRFNVWARNRETRVVVEEGEVQIRSIKDPAGNMNLSKGTMSAVMGDTAPLDRREVDTEWILGWLKGRLVFERTSLFEITGELERTFDLKIRLKSEDLADKTLTGSFDGLSAQEVIDSICLTLDMRASWKGREVELRRKGEKP
jgi:ferric-dicitrate binding protein FerR (iron transport regulator)